MRLENLVKIKSFIDKLKLSKELYLDHSNEISQYLQVEEYQSWDLNLNLMKLQVVDYKEEGKEEHFVENNEEVKKEHLLD